MPRLSFASWRVVTCCVTGFWGTSVPLYSGFLAGCFLSSNRVLADPGAPLFLASWRAASWGVTGTWPTSVSRLYLASWRDTVRGVVGSGLTSLPRFSRLLADC